MKLHPWISRTLYFTIQRIRKEPVKKELCKVDAEFYDSKFQIQERVWLRGRKTLLFALQHVPFYKKQYLSETLLKNVFSISNYKEFKNIIQHFPIIDKKTFIKNQKLFESDQFNNIKGYKTFSSGSTGEPVAFEKDMRDWARAHANLIKILEFHGVRFGESHIYFWSGDWTESSKFTNGIKNFIFNRIKIGAHNKSSEQLALQIEKIKNYKPTYIYSFPSCLERLCLYLKSVGKDLKNISIQKIFTSGENLLPKSKELIEEIFGASVCDIYGSSEVGLIAFDCKKGKKHVLVDSNFIEVSSNGAIIATNFFQRKYVLIRYKIGDLCTNNLTWTDCNCGFSYPIIGEISGRDTKDIILPNGIKFNSLSVAYIFDSVVFNGSIIEGRFELSEDCQMILCLVPGNNFSKHTIDILKIEAKKLFKMEPTVKIVKEIPPLKNGKKVDFINKWDESR